jgi:hypothetical protein
LMFAGCASSSIDSSPSLPHTVHCYCKSPTLIAYW